MKKIFTVALIAALSIFSGIHIKNSTVTNPFTNPSSKLDLHQVSYYGQYNSYNNSYRTNYVRPYVTRTGRYVGGYYRS